MTYIQPPLLPPPDRIKDGLIVERYRSFFPSYLTNTTTFNPSAIHTYLMTMAQWAIQSAIEIVLKPRSGQVGKLDIKEVEGIYDREANTYDIKHHMTTYGMDTTWRRTASWRVVNYARNASGGIKVLDLCTGTGLAVIEIANTLAPWGFSVQITGLDYNANMLKVAKSRSIEGDNVEVQFVRGDATAFCQEASDTSDASMYKCRSNSFDLATQVFGIGGVDRPGSVFENVLWALKPGGEYVLIDMHRPIANQPGEWPLLWKFLNMPLMEAVTYERTTIPLALNRLWGWRDTTLDFYRAPLATIEEHGKFWGFTVEYFEVESQRWWCNLPVMPIARLVLKKTEISEAEMSIRNQLLALTHDDGHN